MKKLASHKIVTLVAALAIGSVSIVGDALATGGGFNDEFRPAATSGRANDAVNQKQSTMTAHSYKGAERYRYR